MKMKLIRLFFLMIVAGAATDSGGRQILSATAAVATSDTCCITCSGITVCASAVTMSCGSCQQEIEIGY
jgi:hypothetical protein